MGSKKRKVNLSKVDQVLLSKIKEIMVSGEVPPPLTSDNLYAVLIEKHRDYARKPQALIKKIASQVLIENARSNALKGGPVESDDESIEDAVDHHNMLNYSLYNRKRPRYDGETDASKKSEDQEDDDDGSDEAQSKPLASSDLSSTTKQEAQASIFNGLNRTRPVTPANTKGAGYDLPPILKDEEQAKAKALLTAQQKKNKKNKKPQRPSLAGPDALNLKPGSQNDAIQAERPTLRFSDMGGIESCLQDVRELCVYPLTHPEIYRHLGVEPPRGILLHGPPGCGKTMMAKAIAGEMGVAFFNVSAPEIVSGMSGESEEKLRKLFEAARATAPAIVFIDEIDAITGKRESSSRGMERRIVAQLLTCMDSLQSGFNKDDDEEEEENAEGTQNDTVLVIGATNRPDSLDSALRRAGRFDREIAMGIPDHNARAKILQCITSKMRLDGDFDFKEIALITPGFVGADLDALAKEAAVIAVNRVFSELTEDTDASKTNSSALEKRVWASEMLLQNAKPLTKIQLDPVFVKMEDFLLAVTKVQPSAKREGFATVPSVTWDDIGSLATVREELSMAITEPIRNPERFKSMGLSAPTGVLLYGPPGCGKTMIAKAIANSSGSNFISIKGPELLNKFVGESERAVRQVFARARSSSPCVVFFDELDSLCPRRGSDGSNGVSERVVNQLLTEMDGLEERRNVFVIAATNRPDIIDPAMLRPGRLDKLLYVPLPTPQDRIAVLRTCARHSPIAQNVDLEKIALSSKLDGFTGADLSSLVKEAAVRALRRLGPVSSAVPGQIEQIEQVDFDYAMKVIFPSVSPKDQRVYKKMTSQLRRARGHLEEDHEKGEAAAGTPQPEATGTPAPA